MRITNTMLINNMMYYMNNNLDRMQKFQSQLSTGKKITVPSDDPVVASKALKLRTNVAEVEQFKKNANDAYSWMDMTENALGSIGDILQRTRELAVQGGNGTLTPSDREVIMQEVSQLKGQSINLANSTYAGKYIFSGYNTDTKFMNDDGSYNCTVGSNEAAVIKGGLVNLSENPINTDTNSSFQISADGTHYSTITIEGGPFDGSEGNKMQDIAKSVQAAIISASESNPLIADIKVEEKDGRMEFSLRNTKDQNGNALKIFLKQGDGGSGEEEDEDGAAQATASKDILNTLNIKTDPVTLSTVSKSEDINYQVGISDILNINVPGTALFGSGKTGDVGDFVATFNKFIDALLTPDDKKSYLNSQKLTANTTNKLDLTTNNQFAVKIGQGGEGEGEGEGEDEAQDGVFTLVSLESKIYDGTEGNTLDDLARNMSDAISEATGRIVTVTNQNGKMTMCESEGSKITLLEGAPGTDALKTLKFFTSPEKTISSFTSGEGLQASITSIEAVKDKVMSVRADIGARTNRAELTLNRLDSDEVNFTKLMSDNEDVDMADTITKFMNEQNVYRASLAGGAKIIMPTLIDFLR